MAPSKEKEEGPSIKTKPLPQSTRYLRLEHLPPAGGITGKDEDEDGEYDLSEPEPPVTIVSMGLARRQQLWLEHQRDGTLLEWQAQLTLLDEVIDRFRLNIIAGARMLEIGAGIGLPGLSCALLGANVVLTEQADMFPVLKRNVDAHFWGPQKKFAGTATSRRLKWGRFEAAKLAEEFEFDIILCADCVYEPLYGESWMDLADTLDLLCGPDTTVLVAVHRRTHDGVDRFVQRLVSMPNVMTERCLRRRVDGADIEIFTARRPRSSEAFDVNLLASFEEVRPESFLAQVRGGRPFVDEITGGGE